MPPTIELGANRLPGAYPQRSLDSALVEKSVLAATVKDYGSGCEGKREDRRHGSGRAGYVDSYELAVTDLKGFDALAVGDGADRGHGAGTFSVVGIVANPLVAPVVAVISVVGTLAALIGAIGPPDGVGAIVGELLVRALAPELWWMVACARALGGVGWASVEVW